MKWLAIALAVLAAFVVALIVGPMLLGDKGYVLISLGNTAVEMTVISFSYGPQCTPTQLCSASHTAAAESLSPIHCRHITTAQHQQHHPATTLARHDVPP